MGWRRRVVREGGLILVEGFEEEGVGFLGDDLGVD